MPLIKSGSDAAVGQNIKEMEASNYPRRQAIAAALSNQRRFGGGKPKPAKFRYTSSGQRR